eukprot:scaffold5901_cov116-Cylindrotheca_fusiformis.AAC.13
MPPLSTNAPLDLLVVNGNREDPLYPLDLAVCKDSPKPFYVSSSPQKKRVKKSVSFASASEMYFVPLASEMTTEEFNATYMTDDDAMRIVKENSQTLKMMKKRNFPVSQDLYFRGLENSLAQATRERRQRISFVIYHVLLEQKRNGQLSPEWVETFRSNFTEKSAEFAHQMGIWDFEAMQADLMAEVRELQMKHIPPQ